MEQIPIEVWLLIFSNLNDVNETMKLTTISKLFMNSIKSHNWYFEVFVKNLINCHTLNLSYTNVTDTSVKKLKR